ncbi:glutamyl-tRNA amidotransferase [Candidatus Kuenenbacteria bacterium CG11_big_fil_rev_8_21_14_0_20_37_9]|uniref:Glutamyl-tRNA amidotransferase n=2 Tax=Candidatus Kueneniibacteriota TaxID=1752740 RepID=A0A2M6XTT2_9BACT|nr:MAG: hypothetical protein AUJ29_02160 [Candidatus Kuenenbacteria bacterium CG1_02_38_13]PIR05913.1 MAG: glutamyl-tRNA amidotransferase [Candidatus Kuenenbacteria bacterium CG11_big_fil_rev_8_21_14_0_20_37_9]PIU10991.1 MAG: glutamyl-tRNA amidotransferase [Candidatus Kuenenbacteria bacterium CG08_land_8_20_14_0_20_37_23]
MNLQYKIDVDLKQAMAAKNRPEIDLLRLIKAAIKNEMITQKKQTLIDHDILSVMKKESKKRQDAIYWYMKGKRDDLIEKERAELMMIKKYLPEELDEAEIRKIIAEVITEVGEIAPSQFGLVMKKVMAKTAGKADGAMVSKAVKEVLK